MNVIYKFQDKNGAKTTISIFKLTADVLKIIHPNPTAWIQATYDEVGITHPNLTRRKRGELVRELASREAQRHPEIYKNAMDAML